MDLLGAFEHEPAFWAMGSRIESSRNWSGAYLESRNANPFARIVGAWTIPTIKPGVRQEEDGDKDFQFSMWIGLDGKMPWTKSMPQVGSEQGFKNGEQVQHLWWQWWQRPPPGEDPEKPVKIRGVKIKPGDRVLCSLSVMSPTCVRLHVVNRTKGKFATVQLTAMEPVLGVTSEWVLERQSDFQVSADFLYPMPDYGHATFDHCVSENQAPAALEPVWMPRYIRLLQILRTARRAVIISKPDLRQKARTVRLSYRRPAL
jgi:hypothetical protein